MSETVDAINLHTAKGEDPYGNPRALAVDNEGRLIRSGVTYLSLTLVVTAGAYSANDGVGGPLVFTGVPEGRLESVVITDRAAQNVKYVLVLSDAGPRTPIADNDTFDVDDLDLPNIIPGGAIHIETADRTALTDSSVSVAYNLAVPILPLEGMLYGLLFTTGTPTYAATTDVRIRLGITRGG